MDKKYKEVVDKVVEKCKAIKPEHKKIIKIGAIAFGVGLLAGLLLRRRKS